MPYQPPIRGTDVVPTGAPIALGPTAETESYISSNIFKELKDLEVVCTFITELPDGKFKYLNVF